MGKKYDADDLLYFLHIPKTAGTTLRKILADNFETSFIYPVTSWNDYLHFPSDRIKDYRLFMGHYGYSIYRILPKFPVYVTMLRDPIEQLLSYFEMYMRTPGEKVIDFFCKSNNLLDFINDPKYRKLLQDIQTHYVGLDLDINSVSQRLEQKGENPFSILTSDEFLSPDMNDNELLQTAKINLDKFAVVGLVEKFEESLYLLCYTFGWKPVKNIPRLNVSSRKISRKDLSREILDRILECVPLDMKLYEYGKQIFENKFSSMVEDLKKKYYEPRFDTMSFSDMMQELLEMHYEEHYSEQPLEIISPINFNFKQSIPNSGWYMRENYNNSGIFFRWSGPETTSSIDLPILRGNDIKIQIRVLICLNNEILRNLELFVNNHLIMLKILHQNDGRSVLEGFIPKEAFSNQRKFTRLIFKVPYTSSPNSLDSASTDARKLGLAIDQIKFIPSSTN